MVERSEQGLLLVLVELALSLFASATLAYHLSLLVRLPAGLSYVPFTIVLGLVSAAFYSRWKRTLARVRWRSRALPLVALLGVLVGTLNLVVSRPDGDDISLFHRPLLQLNRLDQPFLTTSEAHDVESLPLAAVRWLPAYEPAVALGAHLLGLDPLNAYQNLMPFVAGCLWVAVYFLLFRHLGLGVNASLAATVIALAFLASDGALHRSFGNFTIVRIWQGKAMVWTLGVPLALLEALRYLERPTALRLLPVFLVAVAAGGLSASGLFLMPAFLIAVGLAYLTATGLSSARLESVAVMNCCSLYSAGLVGLMLLDVLPNYDMPAMYASWPGAWLDNIGLVVADGREWARDLTILLLLPIAFLPRPYGRFLVLLTLWLGALYLNPWVGGVLLEWLTPGSYWRLAYLLPLPLCAGAVAGVSSPPRSLGRRRWVGVVVVMLALSVTVWAFRQPVFAETHWKAPLEYRFPPGELAFTRAVLEDVDGRHVLAPETIVYVLPLLQPEVTLETERRVQTTFDFAAAGMPEEGLRRVAAQRLVTGCSRDPETETAFLASLERGVDAVIVAECGKELLDGVLDLLRSRGDWEEAHRSHGYLLMLRT